ncbi:MAG: response regulator transcription factor [Sphaerochaeta sp.]|nr:response regulator transcription factor [Sphaerochaeta sp.]
MKTKILIVDDEQDIQDVLRFVLEDAGYEVESTGRGDEALALAKAHQPDLVILDIGLPGLSGLDLCPLLVDLSIPVIVLSSHDRDDQIIEGLEVGAEDYVSKPFNLKELLLRIEKIIRRTRGGEAAQLITIGSLVVDLRRQQLSIDGVEINLTPTEYKIIEILAKHAHTPVSSETLLQQVWKADEWIQGTEMVKVNISRLRKKIEADPANPRYLLNRWGYGYLLTNS